MQSQLTSLNERYAALQKENEQNEKNLEELDTEYQQAVGKTYKDLSRGNFNEEHCWRKVTKGHCVSILNVRECEF